MELSVDGEALAPTHPIQSVPYANISGLAENLDGGSVNASEIAVNGIPVIDATENWIGQLINRIGTAFQIDRQDWMTEMMIPNSTKPVS